MQIKPKKRLGQNFLTDKNIQSKIIAACNFGKNDILLEIGSGRGEFTKPISLKVKKIYAIELDQELAEKLKSDFRDCKNVVIINENILKFDFNKHFKNVKSVKIFGNIPYYISSPIIEYIFKRSKKISDVFLTVQKEFADRIIANPGSKDYGRLSCFAQYYSKPGVLFNIKKGSFYPVPKVDSSFLHLRIRQEKLLNKVEEKKLFELIKTAFSKRRKMLRNNLKGMIKAGKLEGFFRHYNINPQVRAEALSLEEFIKLLKEKNIEKNY